MKKILAIALAVMLVSMSLVGCSGGTSTGHEIALITDKGNIDDKSFNQGSWEGMKQYADEVGVEANYLQPSEQSHAAYLAEIQTAVNNGAKVIVTPGFLFASAVLEAQDLYPEVKFILVDSTPNNGAPEPEDYVEKTGDNTVSIL